jgi:hypothetical protein
MKAKEFIPASKPRNFVAKNQKTAGAGAHKDKKRDEKQGNVKHKRDLMPMETALRDKEDLHAKRKALQDLSMNKDVDQKAVQQRRLDLDKEAKQKGVTEGSAHGYNVAKWYEKNGDQIKLTKWLRKEAGLPKDADVYFDDADLVYGNKTIVPSALVNPKLKFNDLLTAVVQASGGAPKQKVDGVYRSQGMEEGTPGNDFRVGQRVIYKTTQGQQFPSIVTAVDFDEDAVKIKSADNKPFPNSGGDIEIVVDPGWKFLTVEPRVDPDSIIAVSPSMRKTTERVRDPEDWDEGNTEPPNNFAVYINGKKWKVFKGRGQYADDAREQAHYDQLKGWARKKSEETGKKWEVSITGEGPTT